MKLATYVLLHRAHDAWCHGRVAPVLRASGPDVRLPTVTRERSRVRRPDIDVDPHTHGVLAQSHDEDLTPAKPPASR